MKQLVLILFLTGALLSCNKANNSTADAYKNQFFLPPPTTYNYKQIDSVKLFYREAGDKNNPTIVLLHGYPSSSHSYRHLIPMLATHYHVIAPDNLGSGYSTHLDPTHTTYTFDVLANYTEVFSEWSGANKKKGGQVKMERVMGEDKFKDWEAFVDKH